MSSGLPVPGRGAVARLVRRFGTPATLLLVGVLRFATLAPDPWEWDEVLFVWAVRDGIDLRASRPHTPGYPGFVLPARALHLAGVEPFRAATLVGAAGGVAAVGGVFALLRALGVGSPAALAGAVGYALVPAVWLHGVRPLSDPPGAAAYFFAAAVLVRAWREGRGSDLAFGAALTALAAAVRPQTGIALLPLAALAAIRTGRRGGLRPLLLSVAAGTVVTAALWAPVVAGSGGFRRVAARFESQAKGVAGGEAPSGEALLSAGLWTRWLADPFDDPALAVLLWGGGVAGLLAAPAASARAAAALLPAAALSIGVLGAGTAPRYGAVLLATPFVLLALALDSAKGSHAWRAGSALAAAGLLAWLALRAVPPVVEVHARHSPPVALALALRDDPALAGRPTWFDRAFEVHAQEYLPHERIRYRQAGEPVVPPPDGLFATSGSRLVGRAPDRTFAFSHPSLPRISRGRYLEAALHDARAGAVSVVPDVSAPGFFDDSRQEAVLVDGAVFEVRSPPAPLRVEATLHAVRPSRVAVETGAGTRELTLEPGSHPFATGDEAAAAPGVALRVRCLEGHVVVKEWRVALQRQ